MMAGVLSIRYCSRTSGDAPSAAGAVGAPAAPEDKKSNSSNCILIGSRPHYLHRSAGDAGINARRCYDYAVIHAPWGRNGVVCGSNPYTRWCVGVFPAFGYAVPSTVATRLQPPDSSHNLII